MLTKQKFLREYESALVGSYPWAADTEKRARFMRSVAGTIGTSYGTRPDGEEAHMWNHDSEQAKRVYSRHVKGTRYSLKALRALPVEG